MSFKICNIEIKNQIGLAPMAGISNHAYMKICEEMGVGWAVTELISSEAIVRDNKKTLNMLRGIDKLNIPVGVQIFGSNPETMAKASQIICNLYKIKFIDINMGCPVPKVALKSQAGSALLKNPDKIYEIVSKVVKAVNIPVTVKIRSGWDENHINAVEVAKICEQAGGSAITIHARTRSQGYSGKADWNIIKEVKKSVNIPVIGNGDITSCYKAEEMIEQTHCDAVMIGRGCLGNPWLIKECVEYLENKKEPCEISLKEKISMIKKHYELLENDKNEKTALLEMRTNILYYLACMPNSKEYKTKLCQCQNKKEVFDLLDLYLKTSKI